MMKSQEECATVNTPLPSADKMVSSDLKIKKKRDFVETQDLASLPNRVSISNLPFRDLPSK